MKIGNLSISLKDGESVAIGDDIVLTITKDKKRLTTFKISAPESIIIKRIPSTKAYNPEPDLDNFDFVPAQIIKSRT